MKISIFDKPTQDYPMMALAFLLIGVSTLALQDSLVKLMASETSFWQFQTIRSSFNMMFVLIIAFLSTGFRILIPQRPVVVFLRSIMMTLCMLFFFGGVAHVSTAQMGAGLYTYPLFVTVLAGPILREKVGPFRLGALALGVLCSLLVLNPFGDNFHLVQIMPIIAGFFYACNILILRKYCRHESPLTLAFIIALVFFTFGLLGMTVIDNLSLTEDIILSAPFIAIGWPKLTLIILGFCFFASFLNLLGNICMSRAYQTAESSWLAPLDFSYLLFLTIWGKILFDDLPSQSAALGMVMIALAGMITAFRESYNRKKPSFVKL